ncbi:MAG: PTS glucose transporter subunit IIA [Mycobacterium sp.]|nr:PTS glucose transporter subunit IIA [Mycobacterium sp.]
MTTTPVIAPVGGRAVPLQDVPDPVFSAGMVGYGAAIDPPRGVIDAVAPVSVTTHVSQGDDVIAGQVVITYDVPSVEAKGLNPIVPVVVMDERESGNIVPSEAVFEGAEISSGASLFAANK